MLGGAAACDEDYHGHAAFAGVVAQLRAGSRCSRRIKSGGCCRLYRRTLAVGTGLPGASRGD